MDFNDLNIDDVLSEMDTNENKDNDNNLLADKKPIKPGKIVQLSIIGLVFSLILFLVSGVFYTNCIRYPSQEEIPEKTTGYYALENYENMIKSQQSLTDKDFLVKEIDFANGNESQLKFIKKVINTVHYDPLVVNAKNVFGNDMIDKETGEVVTIKSPVKEKEDVDTYYVDYSSITFNEDVVSELVSKYGLRSDNVDYSNILVSMFCDYISNLEDIPVKYERRQPYICKTGNSFVVLADEDVYLDKVLFSGKDFEDCKIRFTEAVGKITTKGNLNPTSDWVKWNNLSEEDKSKAKEPLKYGKLNISNNWCGAYNLIETSGSELDLSKPKLGDGSFENPASLNTPVISYVVKHLKNGKIQQYPIRVEMTEFGVSEDAINWFQSKNTQNRGYILDSEVQYCYYIFKITNLSKETLTVEDNSSLCDKNGNLSSKTGTIYGLKEKVVLKPDETGYIESWGRSTELYRKFVIWGADFQKKVNPVWFRVLAGDIEDTSENKGVFVIKYGSKVQATTVEGTRYEDK